MVKASSFWLAVRADLLCSVLITAVAFAFVLLSQEPGKGMQLRFNQMFIITEILLRFSYTPDSNFEISTSRNSCKSSQRERIPTNSGFRLDKGT